MQSLDIDGVTRFFRREGTGSAIVLVHGSASSAAQWRSLTEHIGGSLDVIAADLNTARPDEETAGCCDFTFEQDCAFVSGLIGLSRGKVHLVGHSYGGVVASRVAFERMNDLATLTLIEPSAFHLLRQLGLSDAYDEIRRVRDRQAAAFDRRDTEESARGFIDYWIADGAWAGMKDHQKEFVRSTLAKLRNEWAGAFDDTTMAEDYSALPVPLHLIAARDTRLPSKAIVEFMIETCRHSVLTEIARGGHMSPITNPQPVNEAVVRFIAASG